MSSTNDPADPAAILQRATELLEHGPSEAATSLLAEAVQRFPNDAALACRYADALHLATQFDAAAAAYRRALDLDASLLDAWYGLGRCKLSAHAYGAAVDALNHALTLRPDALGARCNLAEALFELGQVEAAVQQYVQAGDGGDAEVRTIALDALATIAPGCSALDNAGVLALRRHWAERLGRDIAPLTPVPYDAERKLRIGYISAFFGARNWMKPVFGVINEHDREQFEIHLLSDGTDPTAASGYLDHPDDRIWRTENVPNDVLAERIAEVGLDVLVDLNGFTAQRRLPLFMYHAARVQIGWFNMYATTGMAEFDMLVGDAAVIPEEEEQFYCERIDRVPGSYLAFNVAYPVPEIAPPPCLANGYITFGCLGSAYKLTDAVIDAWSRILTAAPRSRLLLKNRTLDDASNRDALLARFAHHNIGAERLELEGPEEHYAFLQAYARVDIALDTFPYNGGTTTSEALWQGVPVLSFDGDRWASRTGRSLLTAAGLTDWVARNQDAYVGAAIRLALAPGTPERLATMRPGMREQLAASAACDTTGLCRALEAIYVAEAG
jgi:protein O-GlcNAc transferase